MIHCDCGVWVLWVWLLTTNYDYEYDWIYTHDNDDTNPYLPYEASEMTLDWVSNDWLTVIYSIMIDTDAWHWR